MWKLTMVLVLTLFVAAFCAPGWENEPAGSQLISDFPFNTKTGDGWNDAYPGSSVSVVSDPTAPGSPSNVLQMVYPVGHPAGNSAGNIYHTVNQTREIYAGFWWKANAGWQQETNSGVSKIVFLQSNKGTMFAGMRGAGAPYSIFWCMTMGATVCNGHTGSGGDACGARNFDPNVGSVPINPGTWYKIETYVRYSSTNTSKDGVLRYWVNGALTGNYVNVNYPVDDPFLQFCVDPTWGGMNNTKKQTDYFWFDHVRLSRPNGAPSPLFVSTSTLPQVKAGTPYSVTLSASGGKPPYSWTISTGSLFPGLSLNKTTGVISGTPTAGGRCAFTVKATDANAPPLESTKSLYIINPSTAISSRASQQGGPTFAVTSYASTLQLSLPKTVSEEYKLRIYDLAGKAVCAIGFVADQKNSVALPVALSAGAYWAILRFHGQKNVCRFQVVR